MDFVHLTIFILMLISADATRYEDTSAQTYWRNILPQTPIPASILQLLRHEREMKSFEQERAPTLFISYKCLAREYQIHNDPNAPLFFLIESLKPGTKMTLDLTKSVSTPPFLSVEEADAMPFTSSKLLEILSLFGIEFGSEKAVAVQRTLAECEELPLHGERKRCVTSMEAMVEFVEAELGSKDIRVVETAVAGNGNQIPARQEFVVGPEGRKPLRAEVLVSCHPELYPRAVYYCHTTTSIEAYKVHLLRVDGVVLDAIATCHTNTSAWDPNYVVFKMLKVKPGTESICHFLPPGHLIFASLSKKDTSII